MEKGKPKNKKWTREHKRESEWCDVKVSLLLVLKVEERDHEPRTIGGL